MRAWAGGEHTRTSTNPSAFLPPFLPPFLPSLPPFANPTSAIQDVVDGMKLQPCNPNFLQARDAILLADEQNYNGINVCRWWRAFAKRGMGVSATSTGTRVTEDFSLPTECA